MSLPSEVSFLIFLRRMLEAQSNQPEILGQKLHDLLMTLNNEAECRELAWAIADHTWLVYDFTQAESLKASEARTDSEIDLHAQLDGVGQMFVGWL